MYIFCDIAKPSLRMSKTSSIPLVYHVTMLAILLFGTKQEAVNGASASQSQLIDDLLRDYREGFRPDQVPIDIGISMHISTIEIEEPESHGSAHRMVGTFYMRETWKDSRLAHSVEEGIVLPRFKEIWHPDTFFANEIDGVPLERSGGDYFTRISKDGSVMRSTRLNRAFHCPSSYAYYPYQQTECSIELESYGYGVSTTRYRWAKGEQSISMGSINLLGYVMEQTTLKEKAIELSTGNYSRLVATWTFRQSQGHRNILELFVSPAFFFIISTLTFILPQWNTMGFPLIVACFSTFMLTTSIAYVGFPLARYSVVHTWISGCGFLIALEGITMFGLVYFGQQYLTPLEARPSIKVGEVTETSDSGGQPSPGYANNPNENHMAGDRFTLLTSVPVTGTPKEKLIVKIRLGLFLMFMTIFCFLFLAIVISISKQS